MCGVVGDIRARGLERTSEPQVYLSSQQDPDNGLTYYAPKDLVIHSSQPPEDRRLSGEQGSHTGAEARASYEKALSLARLERRGGLSFEKVERIDK